MLEEIMKLIELGSFAQAMGIADGIPAALDRAEAFKAIALAAIGIIPEKQKPVEGNLDLFLPVDAIEVASDDEIFDKQFQQFWESWAIPEKNRKVGRGSRKAAQAALKRILKGKKDKQGFVDMLCKDVKKRMELRQGGHDNIHGVSYLNGERWLDEIVDDRPQYHSISPNPQQQTIIQSTRHMSLEDELDRSWAT